MSLFITARLMTIRQNTLTLLSFRMSGYTAIPYEERSGTCYGTQSLFLFLPLTPVSSTGQALSLSKGFPYLSLFIRGF
jgi:hypothetical protein